ncbi:hypothetical protein KI387_023459, partial [Taxus chinensis]
FECIRNPIQHDDVFVPILEFSGKYEIFHCKVGVILLAVRYNPRITGIAWLSETKFVSSLFYGKFSLRTLCQTVSISSSLSVLYTAMQLAHTLQWNQFLHEPFGFNLVGFLSR